MRDSTFSLGAAGPWLILALGAATVVKANDGCTDPSTCAVTKSEDANTLEEIVVTGTHIRGTGAAGANVIVISREQIDASGYGRIEDVLSTVTQNFSRVNAATAYNGFDNLNRGSEVQLRGLGVGTTLTLVNGQRQGASGGQGLFTDVSSIPASAVERIEVLPDVASALYGSDAVGGVVNIILRRDFTGLEARVRASTAGGDAREGTIAMLRGRAGSSGHLLAGFEFDDSQALACSARAYCAANGDLRGFGGGDLRSVGGNPGTILDPVTLVPIAAIPHGQDGTQLTAAQLMPGAVNYTNTVLNNDIVPKQTMRSAFASASRRITDQWEWSADGRYSSREFDLKIPQVEVPLLVPANNAFNHLGGPVVIAYDLTPDLGPVVDSGPEETSFLGTGVKGNLRGGWQLNLTASYSKASTEFIESNALNTDAIDGALNSADPAAALNIFGDGSHTNPVVLASLRSQNETSSVNVFTTTAASVIADGPLIAAAAGAIRAAVGVDFRKEHSVGRNIADGPENRGRQVYAGFFELAVPLIGPRAGAIGERLDLSLAGRYDHYSDAGSTFNPTLGLSARPISQMQLRGTWGTAFRAPPFFYSNTDQVGDSGIQEVVDPKSTDEHSLALLLFGPAPDQKPETAHSWTLGVDLTPSAAPNFSLSLTYFDIDYHDKIRSPGPMAAGFLTQEAEFASVITRNPTQAQINAVCLEPPIYGGDCNQPIAAILDNRARNLTTNT